MPNVKVDVKCPGVNSTPFKQLVLYQNLLNVVHVTSAVLTITALNEDFLQQVLECYKVSASIFLWFVRNINKAEWGSTNNQTIRKNQQ